MRKLALVRVVVLLVSGSLMAGAGAMAQTPAGAGAAATSQGSITGHVSLSDTNGPARFAHVLLKRVPDGTAKPADAGEGLAGLFGAMLGMGDDDDDDDKKPATNKPATPPKPKDADEAAASAAFSEIMAGASDMMTSATVDATGAYTLKGLKPGTYFVHAILPGYVDPLAAFSTADLSSKDPAIQQRVHNEVQVVTVNGQAPLHLDLRLELGAAISGRVLYEDGNPAVGWRVTVTPPKKAAAAGDPAAALGISRSQLPNATEMMFKESHTTDDRGNYRIAGLPSGEYIVSATLTTANASGGNAQTGGQMRLTVFSGSTTREADAKPVSVSTGEDRKGEDLIMRMSGLHSIAGTVLAKLDGQVANSGSVTMRDESDPYILNMQMASIQTDGSFRFDYVPSGKYTLKIKKADITEATGGSTKILGMEIPKTKTVRSFGPQEQEVLVGDSDVNGLVFNLPEVPVPAKK